MPDYNQLAPLISLLAAAAAASSAISSALIARSNWRKQRIDLPAIEHTWTISQYERRDDDPQKEYPRDKSSFLIPKVKIFGNEGYGIISVRAPFWYRLRFFLSFGLLERGTIWSTKLEPGSTGDKVIRPRRTGRSTELTCSALERSIEFAFIGDPLKFKPRFFVLRIQKKGYPDVWYDTRIMIDKVSREKGYIDPQMFIVGGE